MLYLVVILVLGSGSVSRAERVKMEAVLVGKWIGTHANKANFRLNLNRSGHWQKPNSLLSQISNEFVGCYESTSFARQYLHGEFRVKYGDSWLVQTSTMCVVDMVWVLMARWTRVLLANAYWHYSFQFACMTWHLCSGILAKLFRLTSTTTNLLVRGYEQSTRLSRWVKHSSKPCGTEGKDKATESGLRDILLTSLASHLLCNAELSSTDCGKLVSLIAIRSTTRLMLFRVWLALCATMSLTTHVDLQIDDFLNNATMKPSFSYMHRIAKYLFKAVLVHFKVIRMLAHNSLNNITLQWIHGLLVLPNMRGRSSTFKILSISSLWCFCFDICG